MFSGGRGRVLWEQIGLYVMSEKHQNLEFLLFHIFSANILMTLFLCRLCLSVDIRSRMTLHCTKQKH